MDVNNEYGTLAIQIECVRLLKAFHEFCTANQIRYSVAYGTLLGAVRHKGFIPWDDDIDIIVDRENYSKILEHIEEYPSFKMDRISPNALWTDKLSLADARYAGDYAPTLDIFLLDHSLDNKVLDRIKLLAIYALQGMIKYRVNLEKGSFLMKACSLVTYLLGRPFSHRRKYAWYQKVSTWGNDRPSRCSQCYNTLFGYISTKFPSTVLDSVREVPFEDITVMAMEDYDAFLTAQYGDYMTPPKEKKPSHIASET